MHPSTDDQDWECCGKTPKLVPAKQYEMRIPAVLLFADSSARTVCVV